jgi:hypothetical protein
LVPSEVLSVPTKNEIISTLYPKDMYRMNKKIACPNKQKLKVHQNKKKSYMHIGRLKCGVQATAS